MKKKGFTLVELLAVIVVLAIIALIAVPRILNVVEKARIGAAKSSALGYINSIETTVATDSVKGIEYADKEDYVYDEIKTKTKGQIPTGGLYSLNKGKVVRATFCINGYVVSYSDNKAKVGEKCNEDTLKLDSTLKLSKTSTFLTYPAEDIIEVIQNTSGGTLTCTTSDSKVATCSISGNNITIKSGKKEGQATLTIVSEATSKYRNSQVAVLVSTEEGLLSVTANGYTGVYDGSSHGITVTSEGSTVMYGLEQGTYDLDKSPTYSEVGEYTVYYEVTKEGYKPVRGSKTISITKAEGSVTAPTAKTLTYNGSAQELINAGSSTTGTIQYKLNNGSYSTNIPTATNSGTYTVYYKVIGDSNHNDVEEKSINVTIAKANNTLTLSSNTGSITYPTAGSFTVTKNTSGGALSCKSSNTNAATCSISGNTVTVTPGTTAASGVTITVTSAETDNYNASSSAYTLTNNLGTLSVTANGWSGVWNNAAHGISVTSSGATIRYGTTSGTYNLTSSPTYKNVGTYTVYYQVTKAGYKPVTGSKQVVITTAYAQVGSNYYSSIQNAINSNNGGTITLLNNISEDITIPSGKSFTMNLNGKKLNGTGKIRIESKYDATIINYGVLTISNGTVEGTDWAIRNDGSGKLNIESGTYKATVFEPICPTGSSGTTINGGTFTGENYGLTLFGGTVEIKGGSFTGNVSGLYLASGTITITGGSFRGIEYDGLSNKGATVYVDGGNFRGKNWGIYSDAGTIYYRRTDSQISDNGWVSSEGWPAVYATNLIFY